MNTDPTTPTTRSSSSTNTIPTPSATALAVAEEYALVASNPRVQLIAARLKWRADTAVRRIKDALPAPLEQQIYLAIAPQQGEAGIFPESLAKLLRMFLGDRRLELEEVAPHAPGRGRLDAFAEFLGGCIMLLKVMTEEYPGVALTIEHAGLITLHYGADNVDVLMEIVDSNLEELCQFLGISSKNSYARKMRICIALIAGKIIPDNKNRGIPDPLDLSDFLTMPSSQREVYRRMISQECPDYLGEDTHGMKSHSSHNGELALLKELELL